LFLFKFPRRIWLGALGALLIVVAAAWSIGQIENARTEERLLAALPFDVVKHPDLVRFAAEQGAPLYAKHCAACHGADMQGNTRIGAPKLTDSIWLYGDGSVFTIERSILYGIRSSAPKSLDITEMPAFGQRGILTSGEIENMVQYMLQLSHQPFNAAAAAQAPALYYSSATSCFDCHAGDARGNSDYGASDLTAGVWNWGGTEQDLYDSIYYGRHGIMPAWLGTLTLEQIRALSVYIYSRSHPAEASVAETPTATGGGK
jgi:cytochrome c oxidase cbb3-type subunit 3